MTKGSRSKDLAAREGHLYVETCRLLGGPELIKHPITSRGELHKAIVQGIPYGSLVLLLDRFESLDEIEFANVLGISARTLRRYAKAPAKAMPAPLAGKVWLFAEITAMAVDVFGSLDRAGKWLTVSASGLDGCRPIDMLRTAPGAEVVRDFLTRLEYCVYS
jgi:putative toxin-antitoxin system antitoxin component (TIGR02293 family)